VGVVHIFERSTNYSADLSLVSIWLLDNVYVDAVTVMHSGGSTSLTMAFLILVDLPHHCSTVRQCICPRIVLYLPARTRLSRRC
jgi:hypothetical protein